MRRRAGSAYDGLRTILIRHAQDPGREILQDTLDAATTSLKDMLPKVLESPIVQKEAG